MKKIFLAVFILLFFAATAWAGSVTFAWDANTESDLAGYKLYQSATSGGPYTLVSTIAVSSLSNAASPQYTDSTAPDALTYFVLTAYNTSGLESDYSNEVSCNLVPPGAPQALKITSPAQAASSQP